MSLSLLLLMIAIKTVSIALLYALLNLIVHLDDRVYNTDKKKNKRKHSGSFEINSTNEKCGIGT